MIDQPSTVSIVMPAYNSQEYICASIDSVLSQTYEDWSLIVVDDGSTDNTFGLVSAYVLADPRISLIALHENAGVARARNVGIKNSQGRYIAFLDSDDLWEPEKLEKQIELITSSNADLVYCSYGLIDEQGRAAGKPFLVSPSTDFESMLKKNEIGCSAILVKAELLESIEFNPAFYHEDYLLCLNLLQKGAIAFGDSEVLMQYRRVVGSRSNNKAFAAINRWDIYRRGLKLGFTKSFCSFVSYAINGIIKHY